MVERFRLDFKADDRNLQMCSVTAVEGTRFTSGRVPRRSRARYVFLFDFFFLFFSSIFFFFFMLVTTSTLLLGIFSHGRRFPFEFLRANKTLVFLTGRLADRDLFVGRRMRKSSRVFGITRRLFGDPYRKETFGRLIPLVPERTLFSSYGNAVVKVRYG